MKRVIIALSFGFLCRLAAGGLLAAPLVATVAGSGVGAFPEGDRVLFAPGGLMLAELLRLSLASAPNLAASTLFAGAVLAVLLAVPEALLLSALSERYAERESLTLFLGRALSRAPSLLALNGLGFLGQALAWALALVVAGLVRGGFPVHAMRADVIAAIVVLLGGALALLCGVVRDLASAALSAGEAGSRTALRRAVSCLLRAPRITLGRWLVPALLALLAIGAGALVATAVDISRSGAWRLLLLLVAHQTVVLALCACRALWLDGATRAVQTLSTETR